MITQDGRQVGGVYHNGRAVASIYHWGRVVWEAISSLFLTKDNQHIETRDGRIFDAKQ